MVEAYCAREQGGVILSKHEWRRSGLVPAHESLAEIASPSSSLRQFAPNHLHFVNALCDKGARLYAWLRVAILCGKTFLQIPQHHRYNLRVAVHYILHGLYSSMWYIEGVLVKVLCFFFQPWVITLPMGLVSLNIQ